eukprot:Em0017g859a
MHLKIFLAWINKGDYEKSLTNQIAHLQSSIAPEPQINQNLPTFEEFARALSTALKEVLRHNSEEAWLKLFMLPKCVLPSLKQRGVVNPHTPIESLCKMWLNNDLVTLWSMSLTRANLHSSSKNFGTSTHSQEISSAISLGRSGLMGKACRILLSSGIAPSNSTTLNLLQSKNPSCPHPTIPDIDSNPVILGPSFGILHILRSFTKGTSAGPSGLSIQHLLDAASVPLQTPICDSLKGVVNILASGKAPKSVSAFLSGGRLIALNKGKFCEGRCTDIRPIVVGEVLRRLTGKCLCSILDKLFALVLQKLVSSIEADDDCINLSFNAWYLDDGILVGERSAVVRALHLIEELGPHLGLFINYPKCEVFSRNGISLFPASVKSSILPNLEILGAPIGDIVHSRFFAEKHNNFKVLLRAISDVTAMCQTHSGSKLNLSPKLGGLGLRSLSLHSCSAFISSVASLEMGNPDNTHLQQAILRFNARVSPQDSITMESVLNSPPQQKSLSQKLDSFAFHSLLSSASLVNKARMLSVSSPHASSWITAIPSTSLKLHLDSAEYQTAIRWWLGLNTSEASPCPFCPELVLNPLGHHAASCRHAMLRDASTSAGSAAYAAECRKHEANDTKCQELGWTCIP